MPSRRRRLAAALLCAGLLASAPGPQARPAAASIAAVQPSNRPAPLPGVENGSVPADLLVTVVAGCRVAREAGPSLALLMRVAAAAGAPLQASDCYRPVADQVEVYALWSSRGASACAARPQFYPDGRPKGTSMHGWGKAIDFAEHGDAMRFTTPGYRFLKSYAGRLGWNHPGWAEPGGSACPEAWHWEWVGDGGVLGGEPVVADVVGLVPAPDDQGYSRVTGLGAVRPSGRAPALGSFEARALNWVVVGATATADRRGYWLLGADGGIFTFGNAAFHGSTGSMRLNAPVVGMAPTPDGGGYWLVAADGGIFTFGNAAFHGSTGSMRLNAPVAAMAPTPTGAGYWLVGFDGGVFTFGDAPFLGSAADPGLAAPAVSLTRTLRGDGYWITAADGTVVNRGAAGHFG